MRKGRRAVVFATATLFLSAPAGAVLAQYPPAAALTCDRSSYAAGQAGTCNAVGLTPSTAYELVLDQNPAVRLRTSTTNAAGATRFTFTIPRTGFVNGPARLIARPQVATGPTATQAITLTGFAAPAPARGVALPKTGLALAAYAGAGSVMLLAGLGMVGLARSRRRRRQATTDQPAWRPFEASKT